MRKISRAEDEDEDGERRGREEEGEEFLLPYPLLPSFNLHPTRSTGRKKVDEKKGERERKKSEKKERRKSEKERR